MKSHAAKSFWKRFRALPAEERAKARDAFRLFLSNPSHPSLRFGKLEGYEDHWYVRVSRRVRAVSVKSGDNLIWFWIGSHSEFDREFV